MDNRATIYESFVKAKCQNCKKIAVLIDPDEDKLHNLEHTIKLAVENNVSFFSIGGSLVFSDSLEQVLHKIKTHCSIPTILFPGSSRQLSYSADALLFLSLISGRNPELLIGKHVETASFIKNSPLEVIPTGYMLIDGGVATSVSYMSNTLPIPHDKYDIAVSTAIAGELLGFKLIYMDAGSGANRSVSPDMVKRVSRSIDIPLIVGGGIRDLQTANAIFDAGADILVVGSAIEKDPTFIQEVAKLART